jgi:hypothetical protein
MTADPRLARLSDADSNPNAYLVPEMRNAWPAMITLLESVLTHGDWRTKPICATCRDRAEAVLDTLGDTP